MNTVLKFDKYILVKELNEKFNEIGETFEVANVLEHGFVLRNAKTKIAIGVVNFEDFEKCFVREENYNGWSDWTKFIGFDGQNDSFYKTNRRKVMVKFLTDNIRAESSCHKDDEFNLSLGLNLAYLRARNKALEKKKIEYEEELKKINAEIANNMRTEKKTLDSLRV